MKIQIEPFTFIISIFSGTILSSLSIYNLFKGKDKNNLFLYLTSIVIFTLYNIIGLLISKESTFYYRDINNDLSICYSFFEIVFEILHKNIFFLTIPESFIIVYIILRSFIYISSLLILKYRILNIYLLNMYNISENFLLIFLYVSKSKNFITYNLRQNLIFRSYLLKQKLISKLFILQFCFEILYSSVIIFISLNYYKFLMEICILIRIVSLACLFYCLTGYDENLRIQRNGVSFIRKGVIEPNNRIHEVIY